MSDSSDNEDNDEDVVYGYLIRVDDNDLTVNTYELKNTTVSIGRQQTNDLVLEDETISSNHCEIEFDKSDKDIPAFITDLKTKNKTRLGNELARKGNPNKKCKPNRQYPITSGMCITMGNVNFRFYKRDATPRDNDNEEKIVDNDDNNDELKREIASILGEMDEGGAISAEIANILSNIPVTLKEVSTWRQSKLEDVADSFELSSLTKVKRIAVVERFIKGVHEMRTQNESGILFHVQG